ncbi:two-component system, NtrC family, response regulator HydG [Desulfatibacillum alkenivorans DSM 16219]|jgi:two-component system response regulator HydG|uniref:Two-component system, NtrC family, response regulator HydG n=1 Tax=Desulfatibacillum alkenivorans DSM 16219 TaxID=1121393 RepID=A0A1M6VHB8_9BACT|nr:sigma-54 dependent transcriptional regulator [Desulfatibacillum alkenivorans]SHK80903.1 two-component system, NtrC family, response regulator HydG [Desulfatibacillum alkenivorans DSM 16219]
MNLEKKADILVVDDDEGHRKTLYTVIKSWGYNVKTAEDGSIAVDMVREGPYDVILMDVRMAEMDGIQALKLIKEYNPSIPVLIMTAYSSVESAIEAMKTGAYDYLTKPLDFEDLRLTIERAREYAGLKEENKELKQALGFRAGLRDIIGKSSVMKELTDMVSMIAPTEATVLITGESGTGKELVARSIHEGSQRKDGPLVVLNCAALTETLLESELFGHEKGAFTGADKKRDGRFVQADKGTLFLDEIGEMPLTMQAKLLRAIQEKEVQRVGSDATVKVDVRIIAATNRDLEQEVADGKFREDLFYRLNVVTLRIPPLREREGDVHLLAQYFLDKFAERNRKHVKGITPQAMDMLLKHPWPGNVRELENAMERAVILLTGEFITEKELPLGICGPVCDDEPMEPVVEQEPILQSLEEVEKKAILTTLRAVDGNKSEAARRLGITRKTLHSKLAKYGYTD